MVYIFKYLQIGEIYESQIKILVTIFYYYIAFD